MRSRLGTKREVRPGVWKISVECGTKSNGKRRTSSRTVRGNDRDADAALYALACEMGKSPNVGDGMTLDEYFWQVFVPVRSQDLTNATMRGYQSTYRCHISEALGGREMNDMDHVSVQLVVSACTPGTAPKVTRTLRVILRSAWDDGLIDEEPMRHRLRLPRKQPERRVIWGASEVADALVRLRGASLEALWLVMAGGGLRREEALALDWSDVTFRSCLGMDGGEAWVASVDVSKAITDADGLKGTKTDKSTRIISIGEPFASRLHEIASDGPMCKGRHGHGRMAASSVPRAWRLLFADGHALAGMPYIELRTMRHTHETLMQRAGVADTLNAAIHGRTNVSTGYEHYLVPGEDATTEAAERLARIV
jgi:integrase